MFCRVCGIVDEHYNENADVHHDDTPKHQCNLILLNYKMNKKHFSKNKDGMIIMCSAKSEPLDDATVTNVESTGNHKIRIYVKPKQKAQFSFSISNDMKNDNVLVVGIQLAHPQPQFEMNYHPYQFGEDPKVLKKKSSIKEDIIVNFKSDDIGHFEMPIMFTFVKQSKEGQDEKNLIFIREMVVFVQECDMSVTRNKSIYDSELWEGVKQTIPSLFHVPTEVAFKIPKLLKILLPRGLEEKALEGLQIPVGVQLDQLMLVLVGTRAIFDEGPTKINYMKYFHHLLWWEEIIARINLRKYNMKGVYLKVTGELLVMEVPGLAEKRPSLLRGDYVYLRSQEKPDLVFETTIKDIEDCCIQLANVDESFWEFYGPEVAFNVRFIMSRVPVERAHEAVSRLFERKQDCRVFPEPPARKIPATRITKFYNKLIYKNEEQKSAVEHIVSGTCGLAPYIVFGPPGTGKTMTIVEAIVQIVARNPKYRVMVCTDSNMAADHIALMLLKYNKMLNISNFLLRASSQSREWSVLPSGLAAVSNGTSYSTFHVVSNVEVSKYRIFVTTLSHAAKYGTNRSQASHKLQMSHLFIDEAAQATEPATLIPVCGLLAPNGLLVLAGDPQQLGPVCISKEARDRGLGQSLLERLKKTHENLYTDRNFITMLVKNFRSHPDILAIPNELFYDNCLQACADPDPLSCRSILGEGAERALIFHAVHSREQRMGNAPSYFNEKELEMLKRYTKALIENHSVSAKDIGIIAPYIRQVYKMKGWLTSVDYSDVEVGTVESFQGKEKRVILVSTVRANCRLLDYDAKYSLGFLAEDKRYNVTLTRAKAKLVIIGNPACLTRDVKWRKYMSVCQQYGTYYGRENEQLARDSRLLIEVAKTRFRKCRLLAYLKKNEDEVKKETKFHNGFK
ncbi:RNA helicase Mov10l1-like [Danaus plexippus]|uniref:RNA helicase Mov10l1-like n=1 Tax=Danaus plexippus TaxID=13037 RepID=UPI002AB1BBB3|nr:RNA helicase Mov10l1-like [Danaus plexippus]XP_032521277.2 RNA helicase Mov10l1-like [Danaus plexippus]